MMLDDILKHKRKEIEGLKRLMPLSKICELAAKDKKERRSLKTALSVNKKIHLICELKKASPSEGTIREEFEPKILAQAFETAGASAISVVTEERYFKGNPKILEQIRPLTSVPLLRKDFIIDPYQIYETALLGADAFLIIAMLVSETELKQMLSIAQKLRLDVLVEVHTRQELDLALRAGSQTIGINNRDLKTLEIDRSISKHLIPLIPKGVIAIVESGIESREDIARYQTMGVRCFLIGTTLMKAANINQKILELTGQTSGAR